MPGYEADVLEGVCNMGAGPGFVCCGATLSDRQGGSDPEPDLPSVGDTLDLPTTLTTVAGLPVPTLAADRTLLSRGPDAQPASANCQAIHSSWRWQSSMGLRRACLCFQYSRMTTRGSSSGRRPVRSSSSIRSELESTASVLG